MGPFSAQLELGIAERVDELDTAEYELAWAITDNLKLIISGRSFGIEPTDGNISVINAPTGQVGDEEVFFDFSEAGLVNIEYTAGTFTIGLGISDACVPGCGFGQFRTADDETVAVSPERETSSVVLHMRREATGLSFNAYAGASRGGFLNDAETLLLEGRGSGGGLGLSYQHDGLDLGLDVSHATIACNPDAISTDDPALPLPEPCTADREVNKYGASVVLWGFGVHYYVAMDEVGTTREDITNVDIVYLFQIMQATLGPEYRFTTTQRTGDPDTTDSFLLFGMSLDF